MFYSTVIAEKQKEFVAANKALMEHELLAAKNEQEVRCIRLKYRPSTINDSKIFRGNYVSEEEDKDNPS